MHSCYPMEVTLSDQELETALLLLLLLSFLLGNVELKLT